MDSEEVRKRKEYAERKVKERHAALRKEAEERRKHTIEHRERVQSVLKREQVLLQKRMQQLNEDEERKKATLAKQHEATSRIAAITKSPKSFAFGSSTPRTLAYLDNLPKSEQQYDKKLRPLEDSSHLTSPTSTSSTTKMGRITSTPQRPPPAAHRPAPTMTSMTSSMYVTSSAPPTRHGKTSIKSTITSTTSKRLSTGPSSMMTQSVYTPSRPATSSRLSLGPNPIRGFTPNSSKPSHSARPTPTSSNNRRSLDTRKPPMSRKSVLGHSETKKQVKMIVDEPVIEEPKNVVNEEAVIPEASPFEDIVEQKPVIETVENSPPSANLDENKDADEINERRVETPEVEDIPRETEDRVEIPEATQSETFESEAMPKVDEEVQQINEAVNGVRISESDDADAASSPDVAMKQENVTEAPIDVLIPVSDHIDEETKNVPTPTIASLPLEDAPKTELIHEETSESHVGSSTNTSLADELINIELDQNVSEEIVLPPKPEVEELKYSFSDEPRVAVRPVEAVNDLVDVFGNDFINQNQPQRIVQFDEDTDSGKASPTSSETSSTTDEVTPRSVLEEAKTAPRVLPLVRSAEDMARKEKEAREAEERKNRLAAILAKSRGMASPMTNTLPPTAADIKDSSPVTSPPTPPSSQMAEQPSSSAIASTDEAEKATNESGKANDVLARVAAMTNSSTLQKILQRKQGSNPSLQTSESTGAFIHYSRVSVLYDLAIQKCISTVNIQQSSSCQLALFHTSTSPLC
ncbi:hypothetical protein L3Y34_014524 [Caenorhabditis briggsae]|uniref:Uncharacterized protein n=1 Tax=Caenorhabditis briggsae TaxID=6238 RepID=A0AAE9IXP2_CAEBR|nr:hypothetical protein L3Y34_014524 [Caenorhabditis briggsae]